MDRKYPIIFVGCIALIVVFGNISREASLPAPAPESADVSSDSAEAPLDEAKAAEEADAKAKGFHCLSTWDGSNRSLVKQVKEQLRNPGSFEHAETTIGPATSAGFHPVRMKYRAENGFGGMNIEEVPAAVDHTTCEAVIITSKEQMDTLLGTP